MGGGWIGEAVDFGNDSQCEDTKIFGLNCIMYMQYHQHLRYFFKVFITSSYRSTTLVKGAIVTPARKSNHLIGHAIDMNLIDRTTGKFCNSGCLRGSKKPRGVTCFIGKIRSDASLRWGGDFRRSDPVHIDDATNIRNSQLWSRLYNSLQKNCH